MTASFNSERTQLTKKSEQIAWHSDNGHPYLIGDIIPTILSYCDAKTLSRASCVCHEWRNIALSNELWENLCKHRFGVSSFEIKPRPDPTKLLYIWTYKRFREACREQYRDAFTGMNVSLPTIPISSLRLE